VNGKGIAKLKGEISQKKEDRKGMKEYDYSPNVVSSTIHTSHKMTQKS